MLRLTIKVCDDIDTLLLMAGITWPIISDFISMWNKWNNSFWTAVIDESVNAMIILHSQTSFHWHWDLCTKIIVNKIRTDSARSQLGARTTKFNLWWMNVLKRTSPEATREPLHQNPRALKNGRGKVCFCLFGWRIYFGTWKKKKCRRKT